MSSILNRAFKFRFFGIKGVSSLLNSLLNQLFQSLRQLGKTLVTVTIPMPHLDQPVDGLSQEGSEG
ncbi:hypothetical protein, conserved [Babesia bigemina]|uniref:Uncharacterized protein n=1 Tax=Babesia bigemina TaxID=5866 RepID=A0A061BPH4_BABBI|nr:hypothetical protein, conserved [Babesia bigemina]CDR71410.1 hypothetical protein, conserved [Babesia bigemina]|eukprot:XP_012770360.1 hypothetical protein, conserved [Babesia bigemina]